MTTTKNRHRAWLGPLGLLVAGVAIAALVAGCTASVATPSHPASNEPGTAVPSLPPQPSETPSSAPSATIEPSPIPTASPAGAFIGATGIKWRDAGKAFPQAPVAPKAGEVLTSIYGWSGGYVGFRTPALDDAGFDTPSLGIYATSSQDGATWTAAKPIDVAGLPGTNIVKVVEGPGGLLAIGESDLMVACGGPPTVLAMWTSPDGVAWTRVVMSVDMASAHIYEIDAGSTGYIARGTAHDNTTLVIWISTDGRTWHTASLPSGNPKAFVIDGVTNFAGGYVLSGIVAGDGGCGGGAASLTPSLWWSSDGASWTRSMLRGATPAKNATMYVLRITRSSLVARATVYNSKTDTWTATYWSSTDGQNWNLLKPALVNLDLSETFSDGQSCLLFAPPSTAGGWRSIALLGDDLTVTSLAQTGATPSPDAASGGNSTAIGPAGIVVLGPDALKVWIGAAVK